MATIKALYDKVSAFDSDTAIDQAFNECSDEFVKLNQDQLFAGLRRDGSEIEPPYANLTVAIKTEKGQPTDRVTLKDEGNYYAGLYARASGDRIEEGSTDSKSASLTEKYGDEITGLGGEYKKEFQDTAFKPAFSRKVFAAIGIMPKKI